MLFTKDLELLCNLFYLPQSNDSF